MPYFTSSTPLHALSRLGAGNSMQGVTTLLGVLAALSTLFKCGKRDSLLPYGELWLQAIRLF